MRFRVITLEERIVLDAAAMVDMAIDLQADDHDSQNIDEVTEELNGPLSADSPDALLELSEPQEATVRLVLISSEVSEREKLAESLQGDVEYLIYESDIDLYSLAEEIEAKLSGRLAQSIAFVNDGDENLFTLTQEHRVSMNTLSFDTDLQEFWQEVGTYLGVNGRIDLLACNVASSQEGLSLIDYLEDLTGANVAASTDLTSNASKGGDWILETDDVDAQALYFESSQLDDWDGVLATATIGDFVWNDVNANGIQEFGELGISGVNVFLLDASFAQIDSTTTDINGFYSFTGVAPGDYSVVFETPTGFVATLQNVGSDSNDSDLDRVTGRTALFTLGDGIDDFSIDAGFVAVSTLGSIETVIWRDVNANGLQNAGSNPMSGLEVELFADNAGSSPLMTGMTDANGRVIFEGLIPDTYTLNWEVERGHSITSAGVDGGFSSTIDSDATISITEDLASSDPFSLAFGEDIHTVDLGLTFGRASETGVISDYVWTDTNENGRQGGSESGREGVEVLLHGIESKKGFDIDHILRSTFTDAAGFYEFTNLVGTDNSAPGNPDLVFVVDVSFSAFDAFPGTPVGDVNGDGIFNSILDSQLSGLIALNNKLIDIGLGKIADISIVAFANGATPGLDMDPTSFFSLSTRPSWDLDNNGISDVEDRLRSIDVGEGGIATNRTNFEPALQEVINVFDDLGTAAEDGYLIFLSDGMHNVPSTYTDEIATLTNAGFDLRAFGVGSGADLFQLQTIDPTAEIYNSSDELTGALLATFDALDPTGEFPTGYYLEFRDPNGGAFTTQDAGGNDNIDSDVNIDTGKTDEFFFRTGTVRTDLDAGLINAASVSNYVWADTDSDGIREFGEFGLEGVEVRLLNGLGAVIDTTFTDAAGFYRFLDLDAGNYAIQVIAPSGSFYTIKDAGVDDLVDSDVDIITGISDTVSLLIGQNAALGAGITGAPINSEINGSVWTDDNGNGLRDPSELGLSGITVNLLNLTGTTIASTVSDGLGNYSLGSILPGDYRVEFVIPPGSGISPKDVGVDDTIDSDPNPFTGRTDIITVGVNSTINNVDAGFFEQSTISSYVWEDTNGDGIRDLGENGLDGITVNLLNSTGTIIATTITAGDGTYSFTNLSPAEYQIAFIAPTGSLFSPKDVGLDDDVDSDADPITGRTDLFTINSGDNIDNISAGLYQLASIGGSGSGIDNFVWEDTNANGIRDLGETGLGGVTVNLLDDLGALIASTTTNPDGTYSFNNVTPGDYQVEFIKPLDSEFSPKDIGANEAIDSDADIITGRSDIFSVDSGSLVQNISAGIFQNGTISSYVWEDTNGDGIRDLGENGLDGITVNLLNSTGTIIATTITAGDGTYSFTNLTPADYQIAFIAPTGSLFSPKDVGLDDDVDSDADPITGRTDLFTINSGDNIDNISAGLFEGVNVGGGVGSVVWEDTNADGIRDLGEAGIGGVNLDLLGPGSVVIASTTTALDGTYSFTGVAPGTYQLRITEPSGFFLSPQNIGVNDNIDSDFNSAGLSDFFTLSSGESIDNVAAGLYQLASIGGSGSGVDNFVWEDTNANGIRDIGETGLGGVTVNLLDDFGALIASTTTNPDGTYSFNNVTPGDYQIEFIKPLGSEFSPKDIGANEAIDSDADIITGRSDIFSVDSGSLVQNISAGIFENGTISDIIWDDTNANGILDAGEFGLAGITVNLINDLGTTVATTTTNALGEYSFSNIRPDDYQIEVIAPLGRAFSPQDIGLNDSIDSDVDVLTGRSALYSLNSGSLLEDISAGLFETSAISGRMWDDVNANGIQDPSEVGGVDGAIVQLLDASNSVIASTISSGGGLYSFNNLAPGQYRVQYEQVDPNKSFTYKDVGPDDNIDSDADSSGRTDLFTLAAGEVKDNLDAGAWFAATITDSYVWHDLNGDGLNNGEPGLGGVTVRLYRNTDTGPVLEGTQITDPTGFFEFSNVIPGDSFFLEFTGPAGFEITEKDVGINDAIDSDADPLTGETNNFSLLSEAVLSNQEAGFFQRSSIESTVWNDLNGNGIRDAGEPGLAGITVNLRDASGIIATTVSAADGSYAFLNLVPGEYFIEAVAPTGFVNSPMDVGIDDTVDSDPDEITGITDAILIESGSGPLNDIDAGIYEKNLAPTDIEMPNRTVGDFSENGDLVSELFATDPNVNDTHTFFFKHSNGTLSTIDEDGRFEIVGNEIRVLDASQIDRSVEPYHEVTIVAVDSGIGNLSYMETFRIDVLTIGDDLTALDDVKTQLKAPEYELHIPKRHVTHPDWLFDYEFEEVDYDPNIVDPYVIPVVERVRNWLDDMANVLGF